MAGKKSSSLKGDLSLTDKEQSVTREKIDLLSAIDRFGSITAAAKAVGISYKTAWDRIDAMNNLSDEALVMRSAGGAHGGGTRLTERGKKVIEGFRALQDKHDEFIQGLGQHLNTLDDVSRFIKTSKLITSARNQYRGKIVAIDKGAVDVEVTLALSNDVTLTAQITLESLKSMKLRKGDQLLALIKASWVLLSPDTNIRTSARNTFAGPVIKINTGAVNSEVIMDIGAGKTLCAVVTNSSRNELGISEGTKLCAFFKSSSVILMKDQGLLS